MIKPIGILLGTVLSFTAFASEEPPKEEETKPEAAAPAPQDQKAVKELMELEKQVTTTGAKITAKDASVKDLIRQKQLEKDPQKLTEIIKLLQQEHKDLNALIKEHATQLGVLQYRYPERGVSLQRKYKRFNSKSLEEMEKSIGLEGHLSRSREKVRKVYGVEEPKAKKNDELQENSVPQKDSILSPATISK